MAAGIVQEAAVPLAMSPKLPSEPATGRLSLAVSLLRLTCRCRLSGLHPVLLKLQKRCLKCRRCSLTGLRPVVLKLLVPLPLVLKLRLHLLEGEGGALCTSGMHLLPGRTPDCLAARRA